MKRNAFIGLLISIMLLLWVGCDTGSAGSAASDTNNTGITNGNGNDSNDNNGENNNNNDGENGDNNGNDENGNNEDDEEYDNTPAEILPAPNSLYEFSNSTDSISVAWDAVTDAYAYGVACYEVDNNYDLVGTPQTDVVYSGHLYTFCDLKSDTWYYIGVVTYNRDRKKSEEVATTYAYTKAIYVQPDYLMAPLMYTISFTTNEQGLRITWEDLAKSGQYYNLYRANSKNSSYSMIAEGLTDAAYDDLNVNLNTVGNSYFYKVKLVSSTTESDFSSARGVTMQYPIVNKIYLPSKKKSSSGKSYIYYKSGQAKIDDVLVSKGDTINNTGTLSITTRYTYSSNSDFTSSRTTDWHTWSKEWEFKPSRKYTINILTNTVDYEYNLIYE